MLIMHLKSTLIIHYLWLTAYKPNKHDQIMIECTWHAFKTLYDWLTGILRHMWDLALALSRGLMKICEQICISSFSSTWNIISQLHVRNNSLLNVAMYRSLLSHLEHKSRASGHRSSYWQWCELDKRKLIEAALVAHLIITGPTNVCQQ